MDVVDALSRKLVGSLARIQLREDQLFKSCNKWKIMAFNYSYQNLSILNTYRGQISIGWSDCYSSSIRHRPRQVTWKIQERTRF